LDYWILDFLWIFHVSIMYIDERNAPYLLPLEFVKSGHVSPRYG
jgi:hypothetical protein